jgi:acetyl esterase/lipase
MLALSLPDALVSLFLRGVIKPVLSPRFSVRAQRRWLEATAMLNLLPPGIRRSRTALGGVPTVILAPRDVALDGAPDRPVVLYLHGGAFVVGSPRTHLALGGYLAKAIDGPVHLIDYRLAPEHPYPAGREDALTAFRALLDLGVPASRIVVAGDSAGGVMTADLGLDLARGEGPLPAGLVLLSAAFALGAERPAGIGAEDTFVTLGWARQATELYARPDGHAILGGDLRGLPPIHVQYSDAEMLAGDSRTFVDELRAAGAQPDVRVDPGAFHVIGLLPGTMKRARLAIRAMADFILAATAHGELAARRAG